MKHLKHLFAMLLLLCSGIATAQKFEVNGIHYSILSYEDKTVKVTSGDNEYNLYAGDVTIPENVIYDGITYSVTSIGGDAFYGCGGLASIEIPNSVTSIGNNAFASCYGLTSIEIPNSVTSIGESAFESCYGLTSVTIGNGVTRIGQSAFYWCSGLTSIVVDENNAVYDSRDNCNAIIETASNTLITGCTNTIIPNSVTSIGKYAFEGCSGLTNVTIGNSVTSIGSYAFYGCTGLTSIEIPNSVTSIGSYAFYDCTGLTSIEIPNSVTSIEYKAFDGCTGLTSIVVDENNTAYDSRENCNAIIETSSNTLIKGCKNTVIPNSVTSIGDEAFSGCSGLTSIEIPNSVTSIGDKAFSSCRGLTSIEIPNSVTSIGDYAFIYCDGLTSIEIPNSVTSIGDYAFYNCSGLTSVTIGNGVTRIGQSAFYCCYGLTSVISYIPAENLFVPGRNAFYRVDKTNCTLYVPKGAAATYAATEGWSDFTNIVEAYTLTVSAAGYATMFLDYAVEIPAGVEVYTANRIEGDRLKMQLVEDIIPANTGVIVRAEEGTYSFAVSSETPAAVSGNLLTGTVADTYVKPSGATAYVLSKVDGVIGMYRAKLKADGTFKNNANKAYMLLSDISTGEGNLDTSDPGAQLSAGYRFDFSGFTGVESVEAEGAAPAVYYDLSGRRVENPVKGIYIVNGRKVLIK